jgi:hypothetical protein
VGRHYTRLLGDLRGELRWGNPLQRLLYGPAVVRNLFFRLYGQRLSEAVADVLSGTRSYRELLLNPSSYWSLMKIKGS